MKARSFSVVILDEAHKARADRNSPSRDRAGENNLLAFMRELARGSGSLLLGTATPIQLRPVELWDLTELLSQGAPDHAAARRPPRVAAARSPGVTDPVRAEPPRRRPQLDSGLTRDVVIPPS